MEAWVNSCPQTSILIHFVTLHSSPFKVYVNHIEITCFSDLADEPASHIHTHTQNIEIITIKRPTNTPTPVDTHLSSFPVCTVEAAVSWIVTPQNSGTSETSWNPWNLMKYAFTFQQKYKYISLLGNRFFAVIINQGSWDWTHRGCKVGLSPMAGVLSKGKDTEKHTERRREEGDLKMETEMRMIHLQSK